MELRWRLVTEPVAPGSLRKRLRSADLELVEPESEVCRERMIASSEAFARGLTPVQSQELPISGVPVGEESSKSLIR